MKGMVIMPDDIDKILNDIQADKLAKTHEEEATRLLLHVDEQTEQKLAQQRRNKVSGFKLQLDLDEETIKTESENENNGEVDTAVSPTVESVELRTDTTGFISNQPVVLNAGDTNDRSENDEKEKPGGNRKGKDVKAHTAWGCVRGIIYAILVLAASGVLAYFIIVGALDMTGLFKSDTKVPVTLTKEQAKDVSKVSMILKKEGVIDQPFFFEMFCKLTGAADDFKPQDEATLSPDMGYKAIINVLRLTKREIVRVTFPEGMTNSEIAERLEKNKVCSASEFYLAMENHDFTYGFLNEIPDGDAYEGRFNKYEGYIFPDSYDFYVGSSGKAVLRKFFDAFDNRVDATLRAKIKTKGMTLNDTIILASIIQWEAAKTRDMYKISRVIYNRLEKPNLFPRLQCDSTQKYIDKITPPVGGQRVDNPDYDTYKRKGLPVGAINNPGLEAIKAAIDPSDESDVKGRYYFATNMRTGVTHYSITLAEHENWCRANNVGMYASS